MPAINTMPVSSDRGTQKFRELILYIAAKCQDDPDFGKTRLYKALFYADWTAFIETGERITGHDYVKGPHGPIPNRADSIFGELENDRELAIQNTSRGGYPQRRPIALRDPDLSIFSAVEIAIVDRVIEEQWGITAAGVSQRSHREIPAWELAQSGERIPFETSWISSRPLAPHEIEHGMRIVGRS